MFKYWRAWVLTVLLIGPFLAYIGFGALWLREQGWLWRATVLWIASGIVFAALAARWTRLRHQLLPPLDWDAPRTFVVHDRKAWELVQEEAQRGDAVSIDDLTSFDVYLDTGRRLARRLAAHYHPLSNDPIEHVPVVELLTALELAAEDLNRLCRQVPGGDLVTPAHWKRAVQAAEYLNWANDIYTYLLPIFQPVTGLVRWATQKVMVKPAWRNMQQNLLRWFYQAFVNRLGTHLIELYSGRLAIGAEQYRRLTRRSAHVLETEAEIPALTVAVAGARDSGKSRLIAGLEQACAGDLAPVEARLEAAGFDKDLASRLRTAQWVEVPGYTASTGQETARDRSTRHDAVEAAVEADLLILVIEGSGDEFGPDVKFAQAWDRWFVEHPSIDVPPAITVVTGADKPTFGGLWQPPHDWLGGRSLREVAVRTRIDSLRAMLPPSISEIVAVGLTEQTPFGVSELVLPAVSSLLHRAERSALIRHLQRTSARSKAGRLISQVSEQGRRLWKSFRSRRQPGQTIA